MLFSKCSFRCLLASQRSFASSGLWSKVQMGPPDPILDITSAFEADSRSFKVNLGIGTYRDDDGLPAPLSSVRQAEKIVNGRNIDKEYLPISGDSEFCSAALDLVAGCCSYDKDRVATMQVLSGVGGLRLGAEFISKFHDSKAICLPNHTWPNHPTIMKSAGLRLESYKYWDPKTFSIDMPGLLQDLESKRSGSVLLFQACGHNPCGVDPTRDEWKEIAEVCRAKNHLVFFDLVYQGLARDMELDVAGPRSFIAAGLDFMISQSFAKNMGLYGERVGSLSLFCADAKERDRVLSQFKILIRPMWSSPPKHGSLIATEVLTNDEIKRIWFSDVESMRYRMISMREGLLEKLKKTGSSHDWSHLTKHHGMFWYCGLSKKQLDQLNQEHGIYLQSSGRLAIPGLRSSNLEHVAQALHQVTK